MNFQTHNDIEICADNCSLMGTMQAQRRHLEAVFGPPLPIWSDRVTTEWVIRFEDGKIATIYDWKRQIPPGAQEVYNWRIGGRDILTVTRVHEAFRRVRQAAA
jgi:hypothetical protein